MSDCKTLNLYKETRTLILIPESNYSAYQNMSVDIDSNDSEESAK